MSPTPSPPELPKRRWAWVFVFSTLLAALTAVGAVALVRQRARAGRAEIDRRLEAIRAAGEPVTADDLAKRHPSPPPEKDAGLLLAAALDRFVFPNDGGGFPLLGNAELPLATAPLDQELLANLTIFLRTNAEAIRLAGAAKLDGAWIGAGFENDFSGIGRSRLSGLQHLGQGLMLSALAEAERGDGSLAIERWKRGLAVGRVTRSDTMLHHLVRRSVESGATDVLERIVNRVSLSAIDLRQVERLLADDGWTGFKDMLLAHRCWDIRALEQFRADPIESLRITDLSKPQWLANLKSWTMAHYVTWSGLGYHDRDYVQILDTWHRALSALDQTPRARDAELKTIASETEAQWRRRALCWSLVGLFRQLEAYVKNESSRLAELRTARVALAILRWRAAHDGKLPESLAELVPDTLPAIPADPFDEQPLRYRRLPQGFTVYSVGPDFTDNGGKAKPAGTEKSDGYDVVFSVER